MTAIILYPLLTVALFYLGARATITQWLWSRYPARLDAFLNCAACAGFWYGVVISIIIGYSIDVPFLELAGNTWYTPVCVGAGAMVWTPILAALHQKALMDLGMPAPPEPDASFMPPPDNLSPEEASAALNSLR